MRNSANGFLGFGSAGRSITLSAIFWITLMAHILTYLILLIFFFIALSSTSVSSVWWLTPFYWPHLIASGVFLCATVDGVQPGLLFTKPSVLASVTMVISIVLSIVAGYYYIIDLWLPCIFNDFGPNLSASQKRICDDERLEVWILFIGSIVLIVLPVAGFIAALWDTLRIVQKTRAFSAVSGAIGNLDAGISNISRRGRSRTQEVEDFEDMDNLDENLYYKMGRKIPRSQNIKNINRSKKKIYRKFNKHTEQ